MTPEEKERAGLLALAVIEWFIAMHGIKLDKPDRHHINTGDSHE